MGHNLLYHARPDESPYETNNRPARQLVWVLVTILLFLYVVASYVYWAKIESAWPIFH